MCIEIFGQAIGEKTCTQCGVTYPKSREHFGSTPGGGFRSWCRACVRARTRAYEAANPDKARARSSRRASRVSMTATDLREKFGRQLYAAQGGKCFYTGVSITLEEAHLDHKTPTIKGGTDDLSNLALCCAQANFEKNKKTVDEYREWRVKRNLPVIF